MTTRSSFGCTTVDRLVADALLRRISSVLSTGFGDFQHRALDLGCRHVAQLHFRIDLEYGRELDVRRAFRSAASMRG